MSIRPIREVRAAREVAEFTPDLDRPSFGTLRVEMRPSYHSCTNASRRHVCNPSETFDGMHESLDSLTRGPGAGAVPAMSKTLISLALALVLGPASIDARAESTTVFFEGEGIEEGIVFPGAGSFTVAGALFTGREVKVPSNEALTASGMHAFEVAGTDVGGTVWFDEPVDRVSFFFVYDPALPGFGGQALLLDENLFGIGDLVASPMTSPGDPANFVSAEPEVPIKAIWFTAFPPAYIDDFTFAVPEPGGLAVQLAALCTLGLTFSSRRVPAACARRRRRRPSAPWASRRAALVHELPV